jgi:alanyl-tRNA synthetase
VKLYSTIDEELDEEFHIVVGEQAIKIEPSMIYCALILKNDGIRIVAFSGSEAAGTKKAGDLVRDVSKVLGGSGGGNESFGQGGGKDATKLKDALLAAEQSILEK